MAFMDYQKADQPNYQGFANNLINLAQVQDQREMNALKKQQLERDNAKEDKSNALAEQYSSEKDDGKKKDIFNHLTVTDPKRAESIIGSMSKMDDMQYNTMMRKNEMLGKVAFGVMQDPTMLDKIFTTLPKDSQDAILGMGYNPNAPMDENKAKIAQGIGQHFVNMAQDTKTLADHAFKKDEKKADREFTSGENALNRANQKDVANISADASLEGHRLSAGATIKSAELNNETRKELYGMKNDPSKMTTGEIRALYHSYEERLKDFNIPDADKVVIKQQMKTLDNALMGKVNGGTQGQEQSADSWKNYR